MKNLCLALFALLVSGTLFAQPVSILAPTMLRINYGDSYLELNVPPHLASANSFQVQYIAAPTCPIPPDVSLQAQYIGNNNWHNMAVQNGIFTHSGFRLSAIKLLLRQYRYQVVDCQMTIVGSVP